MRGYLGCSCRQALNRSTAAATSRTRRIHSTLVPWTGGSAVSFLARSGPQRTRTDSHRHPIVIRQSPPLSSGFGTGTIGRSYRRNLRGPRGSPRRWVRRRRRPRAHETAQRRSRSLMTINEQGAPMIKIGVVVATQGPVALLGTSFLKAIQLAKEDLASTRHGYAIATEEIASPGEAEPAIERLIKVERVDGLIVGLSMSGQIAKKHATAARIPLFCICSVSSVGDELFTFTIMPLAEDEASRWVAEAKRRGIKRIARLTQDYPSIDNHVRALKAVAEPAGIRFVHEDRFEANVTDFRSRVEAAKAASPDVYFVEAFNPALDLLGQQLMSAGIRNLASVVAFSASERPELFEGGWYTDSYVSPEFRQH